jgi:hypothetical protein
MAEAPSSTSSPEQAEAPKNIWERFTNWLSNQSTEAKLKMRAHEVKYGIESRSPDGVIKKFESADKQKAALTEAEQKLADFHSEKREVVAKARADTDSLRASVPGTVRESHFQEDIDTARAERDAKQSVNPVATDEPVSHAAEPSWENDPTWGHDAQENVAKRIAATEAQATRYEVKKGDTLGAIVKGLTGKLDYGMAVDYRSARMGDKPKPTKLAEADLIYPGQKVWIDGEGVDKKVVVADAAPQSAGATIEGEEPAAGGGIPVAESEEPATVAPLWMGHH